MAAFITGQVMNLFYGVMGGICALGVMLLMRKLLPGENRENWLPLGGVMGLDGMVLLAFLLAFPANEIMLPILAMGYLSTSSMVEVETDRLGQILAAHGWSWQTAVCAGDGGMAQMQRVMTLLRETGSRKWTLVGMLLPLGMGILVCCLLNALFFFL